MDGGFVLNLINLIFIYFAEQVPAELFDACSRPSIFFFLFVCYCVMSQLAELWQLQ